MAWNTIFRRNSMFLKDFENGMVAGAKPFEEVYKKQ
jgi:hypothetical protein